MFPSGYLTFNPRLYLYTVLALLSLACLQTTTEGSSFAFSYLNISVDGSSDRILSIGACRADRKARSLMSIKHTDVSINYTVGPNEAFTYSETEADEKFAVPVTSDEQRNGFLITTDVDTQLYVIQSDSGSADGYQLMPITANSNEFYIAAYSGLDDPETSYTAIQVTSVFPNTTVEFYNLTRDNGSQLVASRYLNQSRISSLFIAGPSDDTTGMFVNSSKPISVTSVLSCAQVPLGTSFCDLSAMQMPAVSELDTFHVVPGICGRSQERGYRVRVIATDSGTDVKLNSTSKYQPASLSTPLKRGEFVEINVDNTCQPLTVNCSKPCLVVQYNKGKRAFNAEPEGTDPFMMLITPFNHLATSTCFVVPEEPLGEFNNYLSVVALTTEIDHVLLDGQPLTWRNASFTITTIDAYSVATGQIAVGSHWLSMASGSTAGFIANIYGHGRADLNAAYGMTTTYNVLGERLNPYWSPANSAFNGTVNPLIGPVVGGTKLTITGKRLDVSTPEVLLFPPTHGDALPTILPSSGDTKLTVVTTLYNETGRSNVSASHDVILLFSDGSMVETGRKFVYGLNPLITGIEPTLINLNEINTMSVTGEYLDSVSEPQIRVNVVVKEDRSIVSQSSRTGPCKDVNMTRMSCDLPVVEAPSGFNTSSGPQTLPLASGSLLFYMTIDILFDDNLHFNDLSNSLNDTEFKVQLFPPTTTVAPTTTTGVNKALAIGLGVGIGGGLLVLAVIAVLVVCMLVYRRKLRNLESEVAAMPTVTTTNEKLSARHMENDLMPSTFTITSADESSDSSSTLSYEPPVTNFGLARIIKTTVRSQQGPGHSFS